MVGVKENWRLNLPNHLAHTGAAHAVSWLYPFATISQLPDVDVLTTPRYWYRVVRL